MLYICYNITKPRLRLLGAPFYVLAHAVDICCQPRVLLYNEKPQAFKGLGEYHLALCESIPVRLTVIFILLGMYSSMSVISQSRASQIKSKCSRFIRSHKQLYISLIVLGRIFVARARSAWLHLSSPSLVDSLILIISSTLLCMIHCSISRYKKVKNVTLYRILLWN